LHSNGQPKTERYGDTEKGCQKPAVQQNTTDDDDEVKPCGRRYGSLEIFLMLGPRLLGWGVADHPKM